jgi:hypothetical protein
MNNKVKELLGLRALWLIKRNISPQEDAERINAEYDAEFRKTSKTMTRKEKDEYWHTVCNLYKG